MIPFKHVFKELFAERTRILLTVLAIVWGTASITMPAYPPTRPDDRHFWSRDAGF